MCWLSTSVPSQSNTINFNELDINIHVDSSNVWICYRATFTGGTLLAVTIVSVAFSPSLH